MFTDSAHVKGLSMTHDADPDPIRDYARLIAVAAST
jgi:hypothetical protein